MKKPNIMSRALALVLALSSTFISLKVPMVFAVTAAAAASPFVYNFSVNGWVDETGSMNESWSPYYWVNSGAAMQLVGGAGQTIQGELPIGNDWQARYAAANPLDTDGGIHPQNIFRLVTRSKWQNFQQEAYFKVMKYHRSVSPNREGYNGFLFFNRYLDGQNLYYTGIRVDGSAIIKRKKGGAYCTMKEAKHVYPGTYDRANNPNLIPTNAWIGLRSMIKNESNGAVSIMVYMDKANDGKWALVAQAVDDGKICGSAPITAPGYAGIRTDFMDAIFDRHELTNI